MEIILLKDIEKLGDKHDIVKVKPGYGRNYLIPQGLAVNANAVNRKKREQIIAEDDAEWRLHPSEDLANRIEAGDKDYQDMFKYIITNDSTPNALKNHCLANISKWLELSIDLGGNDTCNCELCRARRENRDPDPEKVIDELMDILEKALEEEDNNNESNS